MSAVEIMRDVVSEINKYKLGVPREVADQLKAKLSDSSLGSLLDTAVSDFETADYWTEEKRDQLSKDLKKIVFNFQFKRNIKSLTQLSREFVTDMAFYHFTQIRIANTVGWGKINPYTHIFKMIFWKAFLCYKKRLTSFNDGYFFLMDFVLW